MGLFGKLREKLIQSYRDALQEVIPVQQLRIRRAEIDSFRYKPHLLQCPEGAAPSESSNLRAEFCLLDLQPRLFQWSAEAAPCGPSELLFSTHSQSGVPSAVARCEQANLLVLVEGPTRSGFVLPEVAMCRERLISRADLLVFSGRGIPKIDHADPITIALITPAELEVRRVDLGSDVILKVLSFPMPLTPIVKRFSFSPIRNDGRTLFSGLQNQSPSGAGRRGQRVEPPEPPPTLKAADLEERLRWILTPPIHEVLSDPQLALPHTPFPYQTLGIKWLYDRENALLADEMGLGKTMQAIIAARLLWRDRRVQRILIVCPKALISNWRAELREWWPGIGSYTKVVGSDRRWFLRDATKDVAVKIINYEALQRELEWLTQKECRPFHDLIIIDEAQRIKNAKSKSAQAVKALDAKRRWALTGTPLENSVDDVVSLFGFVRAGLISGSDSRQRIRSSIKPYVLRRKQEEVLPELPERISQDVPVELGDRQRKAYDRAEKQGVMNLNEKGDSLTIAHVFALIHRLRQVCNAEPISGENTKADLLLEELEEIVANGRKALIFSQWVEEPYGLKRLAETILRAKAFRGRVRPLEFHGQVPQGQRDTIIDQCKNDANCQVLLLNYSVGGVGLNLHAANYVFLFDRWWNPAVEDQAVKRCHRLGQTRTVFEKKFYCKDTIEERILNKLGEKRRLFNLVFDEGNPTSNDIGLTEEEIFALFDLKVRPRRSGEKARPSRIVLDNIEPKQFENLVAMIYEKEGYAVRVVGGSHDHGIDIWAERPSAGGRDRIVVQCKRQSQNVGRPTVQQLWGVLRSDASVTRCDLVASSGFTTEARDFAVGKRITLIDRAKLEEWARRLGVAEFVSL